MKIVLTNEAEKFRDHSWLVKIEPPEDTFETSRCAEQDSKNLRSMGHRHRKLETLQCPGSPQANQTPRLPIVVSGLFNYPTFEMHTGVFSKGDSRPF